MDTLASSNRRIHESNLELFRARLAGKLCIALVCAAQVIPRCVIVFSPNILQDLPNLLLLIGVPILSLMILIITAEYLFYKKLGTKVAKYSDLVDFALLSLFLADWILTLMASLLTTTQTDPPAFKVIAVYGFTNFSWKTLLITLIVQKWWLKIIPPVVASILASVFMTCYDPKFAVLNLIRLAFQLFNITAIMYCEDKIKWRMIWKNLQQEKWMQVNKFILNNIPENIMILDFAGKPKFISDYCKSFLNKCHLSVENTDRLFDKIQDLGQQKSETDLEKSSSSSSSSSSSTERIQIERITTQNELIPEPTDGDLVRIRALKDLITNFRRITQAKNLQERHFLIYNGKLRMQNDVPDKSIEVKISFIKHVESEYIILILRDTTQRDLLLTLEETNKYKDQLLASVSHELRAPLNGTINLVESAISSSKIPDTLKETLLTPALRSSKFLLHIIKDIIDMSQIKERKLRLTFESKDLKETLKNAAELVELQFRKKGIRLFLEFNPNLPVHFCTDHIRLSQIVLNLLSNAMKFTKQGTVRLKAIPMCEGHLVKIIVEDTGIGIRQETFSKLFSSSHTTIEFEEHQVVNPAGVGLGLNIASNLVDLLAPKNHPGINVNSVFNQGSIFSFFIENQESILEVESKEKVQNVDQSDLSTSEIPEELPGAIHLQLPPKNESSGERALGFEALIGSPCLCPKVLIVDDNPFNIMALEAILNSLDIKCDSVYSGAGALQRLLERQKKTCGRNCRLYSVVFMDQEMPEMTGSETVMEIRRLQKEDRISDVKIVGCTAHKGKEEVDRFVESGLDQCIYKPISIGIIKDILK